MTIPKPWAVIHLPAGIIAAIHDTERAARDAAYRLTLQAPGVEHVVCRLHPVWLYSIPTGDLIELRIDDESLDTSD